MRGPGFHRQLHASQGGIPAAHGALHTQRALQGAAQPPRMGVGGPEGLFAMESRESALDKADAVASDMKARRLKAAADCLREDIQETTTYLLDEVSCGTPQAHPHEQHVLWAGFAGLAVLLGFGVFSPGSRRRAAGCWGRSPVGADIVVARWLHLPYGLLSCGQAGSVGCRSGGRPREAGVSWLVRGGAVGVPSGAGRSRAA